ncbi:hypothetical protein PspLS_09072 [Pyricularia sp. CBS 133598]|nr:hypothetical protein PspLS_09072 [Pyricularia sp. CBS 133598]
MASRYLLGSPQDATRPKSGPSHCSELIEYDRCTSSVTEISARQINVARVACMFMNMTMRLADRHLARWKR